MFHCLIDLFRNRQLLTWNFPEICGVVPIRSGLYCGDIVGAVAPTAVPLLVDGMQVICPSDSEQGEEGGIANEIVSGLSLKYARKAARFPGKYIGAKISLYSRK